MAIDIPFGQPVSVLSDDPGDSGEHAAQAVAALEAGEIATAACRERLNAIASQYPLFIECLGGAWRVGTVR